MTNIQAQQAQRDMANARMAGKMVAQARELADLIKLDVPRAVRIGASVEPNRLSFLKEHVEHAAAARLQGYTYEVSIQEGAVVLMVTGRPPDGRPA